MLTIFFEKNSKNECRPTFEFIRDMLKHYGVNEDGSYKLFQMDHPECPPVFGQKKVQHALTQNLVNFSEEGFNNKFILLIGPNGSSKSSLLLYFKCLLMYTPILLLSELFSHSNSNLGVDKMFIG